jgi:hypothetical protein
MVAAQVSFVRRCRCVLVTMCCPANLRYIWSNMLRLK